MEHEVRTLQEIGRYESLQEVARNMLQDGVDIKVIAKYTGLSIDEILKLKSVE